MISNILVIGSTGKLGSSIINYCANEKLNIFGLTGYTNFKKLKIQSRKLNVRHFFNLSEISQKIKFIKFLEKYKFKVVYFLDYGSYSLNYINIILDARNASNIGLSNAYSGIRHVKRIRCSNPQYLKNIMLIYNNSYLYYLLNIVLSFQKPVCNFYTYKLINDDDINYKELFALKDSDPEKFKLYS